MKKSILRIGTMILNGAAGMYLVFLGMGIDSLSMDALWKSVMIGCMAAAWLMFYIKILINRI